MRFNINMLYLWVMVLCAVLHWSLGASVNIVTTDDLENNISSDDLDEFLDLIDHNDTKAHDELTAYKDQIEPVVYKEMLDLLSCFGVGKNSKLKLVFNVKSFSSEKINTHYYFASREKPKRVQVFPGDQFGLEWVDFDPSRKTVLIIHGFMSQSNASWVLDMTKAFLRWDDVNVIAVDWSKGGNTWNYLRAVANARRVGDEVYEFLNQLKNATGANIKEFYFVGHSMGAHIAACASRQMGGVARITGLDPAQPCFNQAGNADRLDASDATFVDIIHTNGRLLEKFGFGIPHPIGHADFYPNGGMKQPGCAGKLSQKILPAMFSSLQQSICSHGRAYDLFTESLLSIRNNCSFEARRWDLSYNNFNTSLEAACDRKASCAEMGINADGGNGRPRASGQYVVGTSQDTPYCSKEVQRRYPGHDLLEDLLQGFRILDRKNISSAESQRSVVEDQDITTTTEAQTKGWFRRWFSG